MPFVKLDCKILDSSLWADKTSRDIFLTALLMAAPEKFNRPLDCLDVETMEPSGIQLPAGWYGFVPSAAPGIFRRAGVKPSIGLKSLKKLCAGDPGSRNPDFSGRRMARIAGGYVVLNYMLFRERDYTHAERQKRYRESHSARIADLAGNSDSVTPSQHRHVTQAEVIHVSGLSDLNCNGVVVPHSDPESVGVINPLRVGEGGVGETHAAAGQPAALKTGGKQSKDWKPRHEFHFRLPTLWPEAMNAELPAVGEYGRRFLTNYRREFAQFRNHALAKNRKCADWLAAWRNWVLKSSEYEARGRPQ